MPKFRVQVGVTAKTTYQVEVEACDEREAEMVAISRQMYAERSDPDFQVDRGCCEFETEAEQLSWECERCGKELTREQWLQDDLCLDCLDIEFPEEAA